MSHYYYYVSYQGDVLGLLTTEGELAATYLYDAWGNLLEDELTLIGSLNPIRYRSYYYDSDLSLYYLQSRYYDSTTGRFISTDSTDYLDPNYLQGMNLYTYGLNNPVMLNGIKTIQEKPLVHIGRLKSNDDMDSYYENSQFVQVQNRLISEWAKSPGFHSNMFYRFGWSNYTITIDKKVNGFYFYSGIRRDQMFLLNDHGEYFAGLGYRCGDYALEVELKLLGFGFSFESKLVNFSLDMNILGASSLELTRAIYENGNITQYSGFTISVNTGVLAYAVIVIYEIYVYGQSSSLDRLYPLFI